eukprot:RCo022140
MNSLFEVPPHALYLSEDLRVAVTAAFAAGGIVREGYGKHCLRTWEKGVADLVSEIDLQAEQVIVQCIRENFPADSILSEETLGTTKEGDQGRLWVVDPLDGT